MKNCRICDQPLGVKKYNPHWEHQCCSGVCRAKFENSYNGFTSHEEIARMISNGEKRAAKNKTA